MRDSAKVGVVLFQLGGPDSLDAVEPFLFNLFSDPDIIDFPFARLARKPLARLVASRRARKVQKDYAIIGGKSPLKQLTLRQAEALEKELSKSISARVSVAMRYWHPFTEEAIRQMERESPGELILLPLYPHYSKTTTGSSLREWNKHFTRANPGPLSAISVKVIPHFFDHPSYIQAVVDQINRGLDALPLGDDLHLIFSAHGIPLSVIEAGDPYQQQIEATVRLVMKQGGWPYRHTLCYQSRVGPGKWLTPTLEGTLRSLGCQGTRSVLVVPISFVSDHIETLNEINIEGREQAEKAGIQAFAMTRALNDSPGFIQVLAELVLAKLGDAGVNLTRSCLDEADLSHEF